jgi:glutathione S-transferase
MILYGSGTSRWVKCLWAARELALDVETCEINFSKGDLLTEQFLALNPFAKAPALKDDDFTLFESQAIINYLAEKQPGKGFIPASGTRLRALYDQWCYFNVATLEPPLWQWFKNTYLYKDKNESAAITAHRELEKVLSTLDNLMENKTFLVGDSFTFADLCIVYTLLWAKKYHFLAKTPNLLEYVNQHIQREHFPHELYDKH